MGRVIILPCYNFLFCNVTIKSLIRKYPYDPEGSISDHTGIF